MLEMQTRFLVVIIMIRHATFVLLSLFLTPCLAAPQSDSESRKGTVVVIGHSKRKIVVAADSRAVAISGFSDSMCKIMELSKHSVFTGAGSAVHGDGKTVYWNAYVEAVLAFKEAQGSDDPDVLRTAATNWGNRFTTVVNQALKVDPTGSLQLVHENRVFNGSFLGFENGVAETYQVEIIFDPLTGQAKKLVDVGRQEATLLFGAAGRNEVVVEVFQGRSDFGKSEQRKWGMFVQGIPPKDRDVYWAMRLVELTMAYHPNKSEVGGPIDAVEITAQGIRWIQCKPQCPCQNAPANSVKSSLN
jgi:hypothetical protein